MTLILKVELENNIYITLMIYTQINYDLFYFKIDTSLYKNYN